MSSAPVYSSELLEYQFYRMSWQNNFYGKLPEEIIFSDVLEAKTRIIINESTETELIGRLRTESPLIKMAERFADSLGLVITGIYCEKAQQPCVSAYLQPLNAVDEKKLNDKFL